MSQHGLQELPEVIPSVNYASAQPHRSISFAATVLGPFESLRTLEMARIVAASFAKLEPMARHLHLPRRQFPALSAVAHRDPFGTDSFGPWTKQNLIYWMVRLFVLTDPTSPSSAIRANVEPLEQSLVIVDNAGEVIGGAFNRTMPPPSPQGSVRDNDVFAAAILSFFDPIFTFLDTQEAEALTALRTQFPEFRKAHDDGKVGHHFMVARSDGLSTEDTFELVAASAERYQQLGL